MEIKDSLDQRVEISEPWKLIICQQSDCLSESLTSDGDVREGYHITPDVSTSEMTQFTCPRCGQIETWGPVRVGIAQFLWEKSNARMVPGPT